MNATDGVNTASRPAKRDGLRFGSIADLIAEVIHLRDAGYTKAGNWSLEQMCFHLGRPIPVPTPALDADPDPTKSAPLVSRIQHYIAHGRPPEDATAPPGTEPPADGGPVMIDEFIDRLQNVETFRGNFVSFGPRGAVPGDMIVPFVLAHSAHHLSFLVPNGAARA